MSCILNTDEHLSAYPESPGNEKTAFVGAAFSRDQLI
jgi:hypothetical protein